MQLSIEKRIDIVEFYIKTGSFKETKQMFEEKYLDKIPTTSTIQDLFRKWRTGGTTGSRQNSYGHNEKPQ